MGLLTTLTVVIFSLQQAIADPNFTNLREDLSVPEECRDVQLSLFNLPLEKLYIGRKGALDMGFAFEYPIERKNATILWNYFKALVKGEASEQALEKIKQDPELLRDYTIISSLYEEQGYDFGNEGEILESLAIEDFYREFPGNMYFITGSIEYHEANSSTTIGEIDIYVARRDNCQPVAVGEAKLGSRSALNHARQQLRRFEGFLMKHGAPPMLGDYVPKEQPDQEVAAH